MGNKRIFKECIAIVLCMSLVIGVLQSITGMYSAHAGNKGADSGDIIITKADFKLYDKNGNEINPITEGTVVTEGQKVSFEIEWKLENTKNIKEFSIDLGEYLKLENLEITDTSGNLTDSSNNKIGTYKIEGNILTYYLDDDIQNSGERTGGANFSGLVHTDLDEENDGDEIWIGIETKRRKVTYDAQLQESTIYINKNNTDLNGKSFYTDGDDLYQNFSVYIYGSNGKITFGDITDVYGNGLSDMTEIKINHAPSAMGLQSSYSTFEEFAKALKGKELDKGQRIELTYSMKVDKNDITKDSPSKNYKNTFKANFTDNKKNKKSAEGSATSYFRKPTINKSGAIIENGKVRWTITISLNDIYEQGKKLSDYIKSALKDIPGVGHADRIAKDIDVSKFTKVSDGVYSYTYEAELSDEYQDSSSRLTVKNTVEATIDGTHYSKEGTVTTNGKEWVHKEAVGYNEDTKTISWKVTLDSIPRGITNMTVRDVTSDWGFNQGAHTLETTISVKEKNSSASPAEVVKNGKVVSGQSIVKEYKASNETWDKSATLVFEDAYCTKMAGKSIEIIFESKVEDDSINNKVYYNKVTVSYTENNENISVDARAEWSRDNAVQKTGTVINGKNGIHYNVRVELTGMGELKAGKNLVLTDTVSDDMELDAKSVTLTAYRNDSWNTIYDFPGKITASQSGNVITFTMSTTQNIINLIGSDRIYVNIEYDTYLKNKAAVDLTTSGESKSFINTVEGKYNGAVIGDDFAENVLTPRKMISKDLKYDETTAPNVEYTIEINPEAYDFSSDDTLILEDELGSALCHDLNSIKLEKRSGDSWVTLQNKLDYSYSYDQKKNTLILKVPDATALRLTYRAKVNAYIDRNDSSNNEKLTEENSYNVCRLKGSTSDKTADSKALNRFAITPSVWAYGTSVTINKYWIDDDDNFSALPGAVFTLYEVAYNQNTDQLGDKKLFKDNIQVDAQTGQFSLGDLKLDQVYALEEKTAPTGFEKSNDLYYFVIPGSSNVTINKDVNKLAAGNPLYFENKKIDNGSGKLIITKTILGDVTREEAEGALQFTVTDTATNFSTVYTLKQFTYDEATRVYTLTLPRSVGNYVVEETVRDITGYGLESFSYTVNGGAPATSGRASVSVEKDKESTVAFEDSYKKLSTSGMGNLTITKKITGGVTREEAEGALQFKITNNTTKQETNLTLKDFAYNPNTGLYSYTLPVSAGGYTVEETVYDVSGYKLQSVTYSVNGGTVANGTSANNVEVSIGETTTVAFEDDYSKNQTTNVPPTPQKTPAPQKTSTPQKIPTPVVTNQKKSTAKPKATPKKTSKKTKKKTSKKTSKKTTTTNKKKKTSTTTTITTTSSSHDTPDTGDKTRRAYGFYYIVMAISAISFVALGVVSKKRRKGVWRILPK